MKQVGKIAQNSSLQFFENRKGGKWKDVCAEVWFSHNKHFTGEDLFLGRKCKDKLL